MLKQSPWISAVLVTASDAASLAEFYREVCGFPLEEEAHGGPVHYACQLGTAHFAIHQMKDGEATGPGAFRVAFGVKDVDAFLENLRSRDVTITMEPKDLPFGRLAGFLDPEGNSVEVISITSGWRGYLRELREKHGDVLDE